MPTAIVTGAGSGIGRATALQLVKRGFAVALVGRTLAPLQRLAEEIRAAGGTATIHTADVSDDGQVEAMVAQVIADLERIDVLVNGAGSAPSVPLAQLSTKQWREILDSNLSSAFYTIRAVWPTMQRQFERARAAGHDGLAAQGGVIINISSLASKDPFPGLGAYGAAKVALNMLTLAWAREGKDIGIRVVGIAPAAVDTPMFHALVGGKPVPEGVMLQPDDVAAMILEAVDGSLRYCSGDTLFIHRRPA